MRRRLGPVPEEVDRSLDALDRELRSGTLRALQEATADRALWDVAVAPHLGRSWLDLPWYFAEAYFYRRILEATGYFGRGPLAGRDPFSSHKDEEWAPQAGPRRCADLLQTLPEEGDARLRALLLGSLWGNRVDLSYNVASHLGAFAGQSADLLVDDSEALLRWFGRRAPARVAVIADNAGTELLMDLALIDHLLAGRVGVGEVTLYVKDHPFFVSDTIAADVEAACRSLAGSGRPVAAALGRRVERWHSDQRLLVRSDPFFTSSSHYPELPPGLRVELGTFDLVLLKGDANYRRLCSDARWPAETPFAEVVGYFPSPLCALRTLKAEVIVGLAPGVAEQLQAVDPSWQVNGRRGVIQARLRW
jgi:hypothetical protein